MIKEMALKIAYEFIEAASLQQALEKDPAFKQKMDATESEFSKELKEVPQKSRVVVVRFLTWQNSKHPGSVKEFFKKHPDFLREEVPETMQKIFNAIKNEETTFQDIERKVYPNVGEVKEDANRVSKNPHFKEVLPVSNGMRWVMITDEKGNPKNVCKDEGNALGHCGIGSSGSHLYSLRDSITGASHFTVEVNNGVVRQAKGEGNKIIHSGTKTEQDKYRPFLKALMDSKLVKSIDTEDVPLDLFTIQELEGPWKEKITGLDEALDEADKIMKEYAEEPAKAEAAK